ncbi:MAG TPA: hypothetical protein EYP32_05220 [Aquificaceae bacterium]|nr:hypothetical protein [Aquificaceae bacterium]HIQ48712.1 hypothetical protein [Aquifex aeolicus]
MKRLIFLSIWMFLVFFTIASFYVSYSAFITERDRKMAENIATILIALPEKKVILLPHSEVMVFKVIKEKEMYMSANAIKPIDYSKFEATVKKIGDLSVEVYVKRTSVDDFLIFLASNPIFGGMLSFIFVIYISFFYLTINEFKEVRVIKRASEVARFNKDEILKPLKAIKVLLHTEKILKEESINKAKTLLDETIEKLENK